MPSKKRARSSFFPVVTVRRQAATARRMVLANAKADRAAAWVSQHGGWKSSTMRPGSTPHLPSRADAVRIFSTLAIEG